MAKPLSQVFLVSVAFNGNTWNAATGGIQSIDLDRGGEPLAHWAGDDIYARFKAIVRKNVSINVGVDYVSPATAEGTKGSLVFILKGADLTTLTTVTITNMKLCKLSINQSEGVIGGVRLSFEHESDDGVTDPVSVA